MRWGRIGLGVLLLAGVGAITVAGVRERPPPAIEVQYGKARRASISRTISGAGRVQAATTVGARMMPRGRPGTPEAAQVGAIEVGRKADFLLTDGDPLADVTVLLKPEAMAAVFLGGRPMSTVRRPYDRWKVTDLSSLKWTDLYTRERVAELANKQ